MSTLNFPPKNPSAGRSPKRIAWALALMVVLVVAALVVVGAIRGGSSGSNHACEKVTFARETFDVQQTPATMGDIEFKVLEYDSEASAEVRDLNFQDPPVAKGKFVEVKVTASNTSDDDESGSRSVATSIVDCATNEPYISFAAKRDSSVYAGFPTLHPGDTSEVSMYFDVPEDIEAPVLMVHDMDGLRLAIALP